MPASSSSLSSATTPPTENHFASFEQQQAAVSLGMWIFLATEVLLFAGLFLVYSTYRMLWPEAFADASNHLQIIPGSLNTVILMTSSLSMAAAALAAEEERVRLLRVMLGVTFALGVAFLGVKAYEYSQEWHEHLVPLAGLSFEYPGKQPDRAQIFFGIYFLLTGLHAIHLMIGLGVVGVVSRNAWQFRIPRRDAERVRTAGLYWHLVDIIWLFIFPLLYLVDRHG